VFTVGCNWREGGGGGRKEGWKKRIGVCTKETLRPTSHDPSLVPSSFYAPRGLRIEIESPLALPGMKFEVCIVILE